MRKLGKLVLEDGGVYRGFFFGDKPGVGEVVFNTGMTGYQETLTDPSYCGQLVIMTYPLIGNYGVNEIYNQSLSLSKEGKRRRSYFRGYVVGELCDYPNNWRCEGSIFDFLQEEGVPCLYGVDTRAVTRRIRSKGAMRGAIVPEDIDEGELNRLMNLPEDGFYIKEVTTKNVIRYCGEDGTQCSRNARMNLAVMNFGIKKGIVDCLAKYGYNMTIYSAYTPAEEVLAAEPDGIFLSNGPGDPKISSELIENVKELIDSGKPMFGICLGFQLICLAMGGDTYKLKFGHRGANHPVKDLLLNRVFITSQNHGYAADEKSLKGTGLVVTQRNVNDDTPEGAEHESKPLFAVQYHPEASPGPNDNLYLFDKFYKMIKSDKNA
ncbi:MAG: glutamine-hydrolyzing carbamoyl-phosphate synthase small subunit [Holosporaceae bacterium]|jgi:carbamoyl-phosphate synthase small subunit|nr:glutamine-hydrolyzing carbamoyl-phosphate synthase small subunit [Holosporaceae bacterium]